MARTLSLRLLTAEESSQIGRLAQSRTAAARAVERARIIWLAHQGEDATAISAQLGRCTAMVRKWLTRFNAEGPAGLAERRRPGCPVRYSPEQVSEVITCALTDPKQLGLPFGCWTLDRLQAYLNESKGIAIKRSRIDELLLAEGLRWRTQEGWLGVRVDPDFAAKRG
jgi:transposase